MWTTLSTALILLRMSLPKGWPTWQLGCPCSALSAALFLPAHWEGKANYGLFEAAFPFAYPKSSTHQCHWMTRGSSVAREGEKSSSLSPHYALFYVSVIPSIIIILPAKMPHAPEGSLVRNVTQFFDNFGCPLCTFTSSVWHQRCSACTFGSSTCLRWNGPNCIQQYYSTLWLGSQ